MGEYGSLGCSGDLAPLAHCALALIGEGAVRDADGAPVPGRARRSPRPGSSRSSCAEKEGLALINGTDGMLGMLLLACHDLQLLLRTADIAAAMSVEALLGTDAVFAADLQALRPHPGQAVERGQPARAAGRLGRRGQPPRAGLHPRAGRLLAALRPAGARRRPRHPRPRRDASPDRELAVAVDNPVVLPDGRVESNGNFHGAPVAYVLDFLAIAVADLAAISERRTDRLLDARAATACRRSWPTTRASTRA